MSGIIPSWAVKGARVVCINDVCRPDKVWLSDTLIVKGRVYVVAGAGRSRLHNEEAVLFLVGCPNSTFGRGDDGWRISRFRPLITIEDDLEAHFTTLLRVPNNHPVDA